MVLLFLVLVLVYGLVFFGLGLGLQLCGLVNITAEIQQITLREQRLPHSSPSIGTLISAHRREVNFQLRVPHF